MEELGSATVVVLTGPESVFEDIGLSTGDRHSSFYVKGPVKVITRDPRRKRRILKFLGLPDP